jgi:homoserine kinase type II
MNASNKALVVAAYTLESPVEVHPLDSGTNNTSYRVESGSGVFFLKRYQTYSDVENLAYEHRLLGWLAARPLSFAVPAPLPARNGETLVRIQGSLYALFRWLPGTEPLPTVGQAEAYGAALGELHTVLASFPADSRPGMHSYGALDLIHPQIPDPTKLDTTALAMPQTAETAEPIEWWQHEIARLWAFVRGPYRELPWQVIHGDVAFVNSLFEGDRLTALLDFEFAMPDARALDLAGILRSLLRRKTVTESSSLARALMRGYRRHVTLTGDELEAIPTLIRLSSAVSTIWWLGRALAAGDTRPAPGRLLRARQLALSLEQHGAVLREWLNLM